MFLLPVLLFCGHAYHSMCAYQVLISALLLTLICFHLPLLQG